MHKEQCLLIFFLKGNCKNKEEILYILIIYYKKGKNKTRADKKIFCAVHSWVMKEQLVNDLLDFHYENCIVFNFFYRDRPIGVKVEEIMGCKLTHCSEINF